MSADSNAMHDWFGLTYASYLVLPRVVLQSMPAEWQEQMASLLNGADDALGHHYSANVYDVRMRDDEGRFVADPLRDYRHNQLDVTV